MKDNQSHHINVLNPLFKTILRKLPFLVIGSQNCMVAWADNI
jgi:hypothetical protein